MKVIHKQDNNDKTMNMEDALDLTIGLEDVLTWLLEDVLECAWMI